MCAFATPVVAAEQPASASQAQTPVDDTNEGTQPLRDDPLWEIGLVGGVGTLPDYPAAHQNHIRGIALPYFIYRGKYVHFFDDGIIRGKLDFGRRVKLDLALDGSFPAKSKDNNAREGMPDLDALLEAGPRLIYKVLPDWDQELDVSIAARAVFSTDLPKNWRYQGVVINPRLRYRDRRFLEGRLRLTASAGPLIGTTRINRYFYEVQPQFARPGRPQYDAAGGYIGTELSLNVTWLPLSRVWLYSALQLGYYDWSANENSPLHRDNLNITAGVGLRLAALQSETRVRR